MPTFHVGDPAVLTNTFTVGGVATDPTTVSLTVVDPDGTSTTYTYAAAQITKTGMGVYTKTITVDAAGTWQYVWTGTGAAADVQPGLFSVEATSGDRALDILTLGEAYRALNITNTTDQDAVATELAQAVTAASRVVDSVYGPVVQREVTKTVVRPTGTIWLEHPSAVTSITEYVAGTATVLTAEDFDTAGTYLLDSETGALTRTSSWTSTYWNADHLRIVYTSGRYATTEAVDAKFKEAAVVALIHLWQHRGANSAAATFGGDGAPFGGVPFSSKQLRDKLVSLFPEEWIGPAVA